MEVAVIPIGNAKGIRLTKTILEKYNITNSIDLILKKDCIILKAKQTPRKGWEKAFKRMHKNGDDEPLIPDVFVEEVFEDKY